MKIADIINISVERGAGLVGFLYKRRGRLLLGALCGALGLLFLLLLSIFIFPAKGERFRGGYPESIRVYDRNGLLLREAVDRRGSRASWVELDAISPYLKDAIVAAEDERFYRHHGVDLKALLRAGGQNMLSGRVVSGASTLTMQLARLIYGHSRSIPGKLLQVYHSFRIERGLSKEEILLNYLNRAPFGGNIVGVEAASLRLFGRPAAYLSLAEAALLAGLPQSPERLNPLLNYEEARERQRYVLRRMVECSLISAEEEREALSQELFFGGEQAEGEALHFTDYVISLSDAPGELHTTLDGELNRGIELMIKDHVALLKQGGLTNAACVVLDNSNGHILAMVGSSDYFNPRGGAVNGALAPRQPGSTLKPFTYALAFELGFTPGTVVPDVRTDYTGPEGKFYTPRNFSGNYHGPVLLREALGRSLNIPPVRLANAVGVDRLLERLQAAGFHSLDKSYEHYGLALTLGSGEVTLLELAQAYALFARRGYSCRATPFRANGGEERDKQIFTEAVSFLVTEILSDENLRIQAFGLSNPLILGFPMAVKTGTSSNWRDNWVVGYTERYTVAVWAGDFEGEPMNRMSGSVGAGPLFNKIARFVIKEGPYKEHPSYPVAPAGIKSIAVCKMSGLTPTGYCENVATLYVGSKEVARRPCNVHRELRLDRRNGLLASLKCPEKYVERKVFAFLPSVYTGWQKEQGIEFPPGRYSPLSPLDGIVADALVVTSPKRGDIYIVEPGYEQTTQTIRFTGEVDPPLPEVTWLVNGKPVGKSSWPYTLVWQLERGRHRVRMVKGEKMSEVVEFEVR